MDAESQDRRYDLDVILRQNGDLLRRLLSLSRRAIVACDNPLRMAELRSSAQECLRFAAGVKS